MLHEDYAVKVDDNIDYQIVRWTDEDKCYYVGDQILHYDDEGKLVRCIPCRIPDSCIKRGKR